MVLASIQEKAEGSSWVFGGGLQNSQQVFTGTYDKPILEQELKLGGVLPAPI